MSERGSFVTEYLYCDDCLTAVLAVVGRDEKHLSGSACSGQAGRIVAGRIGGLGTGAEFLAFEYEIAPAIAAALCHPIRMAVLSGAAGSRVYRIVPKPGRNEPDCTLLCWEPRNGSPGYQVEIEAEREGDREGQ